MFKYLLLSVLFCFSFTSCEKDTSKSQPKTTSKVVTKTVKKTEKPVTKKPDKKVKLVMSLPSIEKNGADSKSKIVLRNLLSEKTGFEFEFVGPMSNADLLKTMKKDKVQIVFGDAWLYLASHHLADGTLLAVAEENGKTSKKSAWYTQETATFGFDKLAKRKIVFSSPTDISGYLFPYASLINKGVLKKGEDINKRFSSVLFAGSSAAILEDLIAKRADAGPALVEEYEKLDEAKQKKLKLLFELEAVPNDCFFARSGTKLSVLHKVRDALIEISKTEKGSALLKEVYGVTKLIKRSHSDHVQQIEKAQLTVGHDYIIGAVKSKSKPVTPKPKK